jgi:hypothetical protein
MILNVKFIQIFFQVMMPKGQYRTLFRNHLTSSVFTLAFYFYIIERQHQQQMTKPNEIFSNRVNNRAMVFLFTFFLYFENFRLPKLKDSHRTFFKKK